MISSNTCSPRSLAVSRQIQSFPKAEEKSVNYLDLVRVSPQKWTAEIKRKQNNKIMPKNEAKLFSFMQSYPNALPGPVW